MRIGFTVRASFATTIERLFDFTKDAANFVSFTGFGIVPGIKEASYITPGPPALGARRRIVKTDGTEHIEEIIVFEQPARHSSRITGLKPPFSWLVTSGEDDWRFAAERGGTAVERDFSFELTTPLAWIAAFPLLQIFMREAVRRDLREIQRQCTIRSESAS
jgi:hypothetical protein